MEYTITYWTGLLMHSRVIPSFSGKVVVIVAGACIEVWWLHVCGLARVAAACFFFSFVPIAGFLKRREDRYREPVPEIGFAGSILVGSAGSCRCWGSHLKFRHPSAWSFELSGSVAALASACSFRVAFQALCGVNYKPGFGGFARSRAGL
ncbi:hypothetical protein Bca52824_059054 [Brassica carinata]|uniref:Uncharacterized protein n=1 Tax=Brassica carinata TaxID=52824 RepID=A0A8X7QTM6_BRACI|nr:hypothetical protein Bca52824_059054 [Brassica carinata]